MSKLTLKVDELTIQSFPTTERGVDWNGTVRGMSGDTCDEDTCESCDQCTDMDTCVVNSCAPSCPITCASCPVSCNPAQCPSADGRC